MKLDKKTLDSLLNLPDDKLIMMLRVLSKGEFPKKDVDDSTLAGIRAMLSQLTDNDLERITYLISVYKKAKKA